MLFEVSCLEELNTVAKKIAKHLEHRIVLFDAPMGAGKTTLIKQMAQCLGSEDRISSPTFSLVNEYKAQGKIVYHFDLYRIKSLEEALDFGIEEYLDSNQYCWIEWPQLIFPLLPEKFHTIKIVVNSELRRIEFR